MKTARTTSQLARAKMNQINKPLKPLVASRCYHAPLNILITRNNDIVKKGIKDFLFLIPITLKVLLVINKFIKPIVELKPNTKTLIIAISCEPIAVYSNFAEKGVIKVHPDIT